MKKFVRYSFTEGEIEKSLYENNVDMLRDTLQIEYLIRDIAANKTKLSQSLHEILTEYEAMFLQYDKGDFDSLVEVFEENWSMLGLLPDNDYASPNFDFEVVISKDDGSRQIVLDKETLLEYY